MPCESYFTRYGFIWPEALNCEQYPTSSENAICMDPRKNEAGAKAMTKAPPVRSAHLPSNQVPSFPSMRVVASSSASCCQCNTSAGYRLLDDGQTRKTCTPPCYSPYFSDEQSKSMINIWLTFLSLLCAVSCAFVLLTFFIDMTRFKYPQRPIIFLALCYFFVSCGYLIRLALGHENVACRLDNKVNIPSASSIQAVH